MVSTRSRTRAQEEVWSVEKSAGEENEEEGATNEDTHDHDETEAPGQTSVGKAQLTKAQRVRKSLKRIAKPSEDRTVGTFRGFLCIIGIFALLLYRYHCLYCDKQNADELSTKPRVDPFSSHPDWLLSEENWHYYCLFVFLTLYTWWVTFVSAPSFRMIRLGWALTSSILLVKKLVDFYHFE